MILPFDLQRSKLQKENICQLGWHFLTLRSGTD